MPNESFTNALSNAWETPAHCPMRSILIANHITQRHFEYLERVTTAQTQFADDPDQLEIALADIGPPKPWLILVPNNLVTQWCNEATKLSAFFRLVVYHTERKSKDVEVAINEFETVKVEITRLTKVLTKGSREMMNILGDTQKDITRVTLVITTPNSHIRRHGPRALSNRRLLRYTRQVKANKITETNYKKKCADAKEGGRLWGVCDKFWPANLSEIFGGLVIDEAHGYRNPSSQSTIAAKWVKADHRFLMTATPVWHSMRDVMGYLHLLQTQKNVKLQHPFSMLETAQGATGIATRSPYDPDFVNAHTDADGNIDEDTRRRALTSAAYRKYVLKDKCTEPHLALERIFDETLVRHNYSSSLPPGQSEHSIAKNLPNALRFTRECNLSPDYQRIFEYYSENLYNKIRMPINSRGSTPGAKSEALGININAHRALESGSTWPVLLLVGIPKDDPLIRYQVETLEANRKEHVRRAREIARQKAIREKKKLAERDAAHRWKGWPHVEPDISKVKLPSKFPPKKNPVLPWAVFGRLPYIAQDRLEDSLVPCTGDSPASLKTDLKMVLCYVQETPLHRSR